MESKNIDNDILPQVNSEVGKIFVKPNCFENWIMDCADDHSIGGEANTKKLQEAVKGIIDELQCDSVHVPPKNIAVPAIMANSYTDDDELRMLYANLIASSMVENSFNKAHPSFVEIIKQLTPREAILLKRSNLLTTKMPICEVRVQKKPWFNNIKCNFPPNNIFRFYSEGYTVHRFYMPQIKDIHPNELEIMIENFIRLQLIECQFEKIIIDEKAYEMFYKDHYMERIEKEEVKTLPVRAEVAHIKGVLIPTKYGQRFYEVCIK